MHIELDTKVQISDGRIGFVSAANDVKGQRNGRTLKVCVGLRKAGGGVEQIWFDAKDVAVLNES